MVAGKAAQKLKRSSDTKCHCQVRAEPQKAESTHFQCWSRALDFSSVAIGYRSDMIPRPQCVFIYNHLLLDPSRMQTNVHIDTKNLRPSPEHRIKGSGQKRTLEVSRGFSLSFRISNVIEGAVFWTGTFKLALLFRRGADVDYFC